MVRGQLVRRQLVRRRLDVNEPPPQADQHAARVERRTRAAVALVGALGLVAATLILLLGSDERRPSSWTVVAVIGGFLASEWIVVNYQIRRETYTVSVNELPFVVGLAVLTPGQLLVARLVGALIGECVRRLPPLKIAFNLGLFAIETAIATAIVDRYAGADDSTRSFLVIGLAILAVGVVNTAAISLILSLNEPASPTRVARLAGRSALHYVINGSLGIVIIAAMSRGDWLVIFGIVPLVGLLAWARSVAQLSQRHQQLDSLYQFTRTVAACDEREMLEVALTEIQRLMNVEWVEARFAATERRSATVLRLDDRSGLGIEFDQLPPGAPAAQFELTEPRTFVGRTELAPVFGQFGEPVHNALALPLTNDDVRGVVLAANRLGTSGGFTARDVASGSALVNHLAAVLKGSLLARQVAGRHRRDPVTGLYTLAGLEHRFPGGELDAGSIVAVIVLEDHKEVTETLGPGRLDDVLATVAARLRSVAPDSALIARLGGSEFVVVLAEGRRGVPVDWVTRVLDALHEPFVIGEMTIGITPLLGVAGPISEPAPLLELIRRSAAAASGARREVRPWSAEGVVGDDRRVRRLVLASALRPALQTGDLDVWYQPEIDLATGDVVGAEALVRWNGADHGPVPAHEIVELAERDHLVARAQQPRHRRGLAAGQRPRRARPSDEHRGQPRSARPARP